jgi:hypothetical protein
MFGETGQLLRSSLVLALSEQLLHRQQAVIK